ncbi:senescence-specific cysteine protease SAG39 [Trifolium repens]|nr:senescence-specific cysteine protease SAG39 [Trifolium repens]
MKNKHVNTVILLMFWMMLGLYCLLAYRVAMSSSRFVDGDEAHKQWMLEFNRTYANRTEMEIHREIFKQNLKDLETLSNIIMYDVAGNSCTYGLSEFADLTKEEIWASASRYGLVTKDPFQISPYKNIWVRRAEETLFIIIPVVRLLILIYYYLMCLESLC